MNALVILAQAGPAVTGSEILTPGLAALFGGLGPLGGVIFVVYYFLKREAERDKDRDLQWQGAIGAIITRVENMEKANIDAHKDVVTQFRSSVAEFREDRRQTVDNLMSVNRDVIQTVGAVTSRLGETGAQVAVLGERVEKLDTAITQLADQVEKLAEKQPDKMTTPRKTS